MPEANVAEMQEQLKGENGVDGGTSAGEAKPGEQTPENYKAEAEKWRNHRSDERQDHMISER